MIVSLKDDHQENYRKRGDRSFTMIWLARISIQTMRASIHFHWSPDFQPQTITDELTPVSSE